MPIAKVLVDLMAVVSTLHEVEKSGHSGVPENVVYLALGSDIHRFQRIKDFVIRNGYVEVEKHCFYLTSKGRDFAKKLEVEMKRETNTAPAATEPKH